MELSIIIITKNEEKALPRLLNSIKSQNYKDYEIIVSDAQSTDKTRNIAKRFNCKITKGGLPSEGRNNGAKIAKGDIFIFLDADGFLPKNFLKKNLAEFRKRKLIVATTYYLPLSDKIFDKLIYFIANLWRQLSQYWIPFTGGFCIIVKKSAFSSFLVIIIILNSILIIYFPLSI